MSPPDRISGARADDPRNWSAPQVEEFADSASPEEVAALVEELLGNPDARSIAVLRAFLASRHGNMMLKPVPSQLAVRGLIRLGKDGAQALRDALLAHEGPRVRYASGALAALWHVAEGRGLVETTTRVGPHLLAGELPLATREAAAQAVSDIFAEALVDPDAFSLVCRFAYDAALYSDSSLEGMPTVAPSEVMALFGEASIKLSRSVLREFEALILAEEREEV